MTGIQIIKDVGLKITIPRIRILQLLESHKQRHMSAEDMYKALIKADTEIGLATIYRVLSQFEETGLVIRHHFGTGHSVFELAGRTHHDHMICEETGDIIEFKDKETEQRQREFAESCGYELQDHSLILFVKPKSS